MCGILGYFSKRNYDIDSLESSMLLIKHRGPDFQAELKISNFDSNLHLSHLRLSIIDVSPRSNQPFSSQCDQYIIVFNGEIYNYKKLKEKYLSDFIFQTESDTEVILELYKRYNVQMLSWLEGMFAFSIYDKQKKELFVARDSLGIKPIYYFHDHEKYIFSSEIKPLFTFPGVRKEIDTTFLEEFLRNGFIYEPDTGFKNIKKVYPGSYHVIKVTDNEIQLRHEKYWSPETSTNEQNIDHLLNTTIDQHLVSDVPVGTFFSGGVDSTVIINEIKQDTTLLTLKSDKNDVKASGFSSDYYYANKIADHLNKPLTEIQLDTSARDNLLNEITHIASSVEEPIADYTFIASQKLSKAARDRNLIVMLSGMGADEVFAGYPRYSLVQYENIYKIMLPFSPLLRISKSFSKKVDRFNNYFKNTEFVLKYSSLVGYFSSEEINNLTKLESQNVFVQKLNKKLESYEDCSPLKKAMLLDKDGFLSHNFMVGDKSSMLESIELRVPLATRSLFDYTFSIPDNELLNIRTTKILLKKHLEKSLPKKLIYRKKAGFNPPLDKKILKLGKDKIYKYCYDNGLFDILNEKPFKEILNNHFSNKINNTYKIYSLLFLSAWYKFANT